MKKFLFIVFCFTFVCACKTAQKEVPSQEVKQEEQQIIVQEVKAEEFTAKPEVKEENTVKQTTPKTETK